MLSTLYVRMANKGFGAKPCINDAILRLTRRLLAWEKFPAHSKNH